MFSYFKRDLFWWKKLGPLGRVWRSRPNPKNPTCIFWRKNWILNSKNSPFRIVGFFKTYYTFYTTFITFIIDTKINTILYRNFVIYMNQAYLQHCSVCCFSSLYPVVCTYLYICTFSLYCLAIRNNNEKKRFKLCYYWTAA